MSHRLYTTDALVLASYDSNEANKVFLLFTRELGVVRASAQGIRKISSKLRFALQTYSYAHVSLIRGRYGWKITNALPIESTYSELSASKRTIFFRITSLIVRLVQGEERDPELYDILMKVYTDLSGVLEKEHYASLEAVTVARILMHLGYLGVEARGLLQDSYALSVSDRSKLISYINEALASSQL